MSITKNIRISEVENDNWNSKIIHSVLKGDLKILYNVMNEKMIPKAKLTMREIRAIERIEEVISHE